jgi:tetratricopeptide (TPR) repeat protein
LIDGGRFAELERRAGELRRRYPDSGSVWKALGIALTMQSADAADAWSRAAALLPNDPQAHRSLGDALLQQGQLPDAAASYRRALVLDPNSAAVHNNLGNVLLRLGLAHDAAESYRRALVLEPRFALALNNLGNALRSAGRLDEAIASYGRALAVDPDYPEAHNNLGNACLDAGRLDEAQTHYRRALALQPEFAEAHNNLGNALRSLGRFEAAVACYARAVELNTRFAGAHSNMSDALRDLGRPHEAAMSSRRALEIDPTLTVAHNSLGNALMDLGEFDAAAASYRRALDAHPDFTVAAVNLGIVLRLSGAAAAAEEHCRELLERHPQLAAACILLAELQADAGRFAEAEALLERAAGIDPNSAQACAGIPHLRRMTPDDGEWLTRAQRIVARRPPPREEVPLRYALGKYFDDTRDFERAFGEYQRANELRKSYSEPFDRERLSRSVDGMIAAHDREWAARLIRARKAGGLARPRLDAEDSARAVFIVGMPRSGTTLAEQILASHPSVFGAGELSFWSSVRPSAKNAELGAEYLQLLRRLSPDAVRVVDKMPANVWSLGPILEALPQARIIHMQRNPLDTCLSLYFQHFSSGHAYANDLGDLAHYYTEYRRLVGHWRASLPEDTILDLPYEGLVDDPPQWTRTLLEFIGVSWDPRCLEFHESGRSVRTASKWQVRQRINRSAVARWRNYQAFLGPLSHLV